MISDLCGWRCGTGSIKTAACRKKKVAASIKKTGNTPYEFAELDIDMDDDIFLPVQALNVLRRNALERLRRH